MLILTLKYDCTFRSLRSVSLSGPYPYDSRSLFPGLIHLAWCVIVPYAALHPQNLPFPLGIAGTSMIMQLLRGRRWLWSSCNREMFVYFALSKFFEACADWHEKLMYVDWRHGICGADWHFDKHDFAVCRLTRWHTLICNVPIDTSLNVDMQCADWHFELWDKQGVDWHFDMHWYARCRMALGICRFAQLVQEYLVWSIDWI